MRIWIGAVACAVWVVAAGGCEREGDWREGLSEYQWPIVDGVREPGEQGVVFLYHDWGAGCTGSAIAPRVVLTAKHCAAGRPAVGMMVGQHVRRGRVPRRDAHDGSSIISDIAVMILTEDFEFPLKRWEFLPWPGFRNGASIEAIGYGQTNPADTSSAGTKYRRGGSVVSITGPLEFITYGENTCQGDSGGPILFDDVVTGIVSRGEEGCTGYGIMTRVSGFADLVLQALRDTGACVPTSFEVCNGLDDDCWNGPDDALGGSCACSDGAAPRAETCNGVDDDCNAAVDDLPSCACTGGVAPGTETCNGSTTTATADRRSRRMGEPCGADTECSGAACVHRRRRVCTAHCTSGGTSAPTADIRRHTCGEGLPPRVRRRGGPPRRPPHVRRLLRQPLLRSAPRRRLRLLPPVCSGEPAVLRRRDLFGPHRILRCVRGRERPSRGAGLRRAVPLGRGLHLRSVPHRRRSLRVR